jgi:hypothetical protein
MGDEEGSLLLVKLHLAERSALSRLLLLRGATRQPVRGIPAQSTDWFLSFFFLRRRLAAHSEDGSHPIELADADRETEALMQQALHRRTGDKGIALAMFLQKGENFPAQLSWVPMPSIGQGALSFTLHPLE